MIESQILSPLIDDRIKGDYKGTHFEKYDSSDWLIQYSLIFIFQFNVLRQDLSHLLPPCLMDFKPNHKVSIGEDKPKC